MLRSGSLDVSLLGLAYSAPESTAGVAQLARAPAFQVGGAGSSPALRFSRRRPGFGLSRGCGGCAFLRAHTGAVAAVGLVAGFESNTEGSGVFGLPVDSGDCAH